MDYVTNIFLIVSGAKKSKIRVSAWSVLVGALFLVSLAGSSLGREKEISGVSCKGTNPIH